MKKYRRFFPPVCFTKRLSRQNKAHSFAFNYSNLCRQQITLSQTGPRDTAVSSSIIGDGGYFFQFGAFIYKGQRIFNHESLQVSQYNFAHTSTHKPKCFVFFNLCHVTTKLFSYGEVQSLYQNGTETKTDNLVVKCKCCTTFNSSIRHVTVRRIISYKGTNGKTNSNA